MEIHEFQGKIDQWADSNDTDVIAYFGVIRRQWDDEIINICRNRKLRKNILLMLTTWGGDPHAAYRIARCLQEAYKTNTKNEYGTDTNAKNSKSNFIVLIDGACKSAGTLICLGADKLLMSGNGELGPIDVQLLKQDEVGERTSGLTSIQAIQFLETQSIVIFKRHFGSLRFSPELGLSTKMAASISMEITPKLLAPIYEQIDPMRLAEDHRSIRIALEYGARLQNNNLYEHALDTLIAKYPSHDFVIDRSEAKTLFKKVEPIPFELRELVHSIKKSSQDYLIKEEPFMCFLTTEPKPQEQSQDKSNGE